MRPSNKLALLSALIVPTMACAALSAQGANGKLESQATIPMNEARASALRLYPGQVMKEELETEGGGSGLRYSFDILQGKKWREIGVDAKTGRILEDHSESANPKD
jgi:uncharacterized membrane protein YkoI